jgi:DNA-binding GntR family transcriptional regulator
VENLKKQVYDRILDSIIRKTYPVDYILKEKELSELFGVSKSPVREALIELSKENIVKSIPRAGYRIIQFTEKDIYETSELRLILELSVLDKIIAQINADVIRELTSIVDEAGLQQNKAGTLPLDLWWSNNIRFHLKLNETAGNMALNSTLETVMHRLWRAIAQLFWGGGPNDYLSTDPNIHRDLLKALAAKDITESDKILRHDILSISEYFNSRYQNQ